MRFLFITQYFPPETGASQLRLSSVVRELSKLGHRVEVVTAMPNYPHGKIFPAYRGRLYQKEIWNGITIHRVWAYASVGAGVKRLFNYLSFTLTCFLGILRSKKADCVFVESPPLFLSIPGYLVSRLWKARFIFNVADLWPDAVQDMGLIHEGPVLRAVRNFESWSYRRATYINAVTEHMTRTLLQDKGVPPAKLLFLPNGIDADHFQPLPPDAALLKKLGLQGKKVVLYAGNHGYLAGLEYALYAARFLEAESNIHFLFVGGGSEKQVLLALADRWRLKNATFLDPVPVEEVPRYFSIAHCCLVMARDCAICNGARPAKIFAIMASGKPVILSSAGESVGLIGEAESGIVVPPESPEALANAIRKIVGDPALATRLGVNGRKYVEQKFRWSTIVREWLAQWDNHSGLLSPDEDSIAPTSRLAAKPPETLS
jgi:colanic acid biosynthesis glycosyl transferase WcaI